MPLKRPPKATAENIRAKTEDIFLTKYAELNEEQKAAVDAIEGPVLVIAGPGTGKTQVLAMRAANILRKTQANPGNILCLTFSTAGVKAMRDRLRGLIGPDAYGIAVDTVHGFCNDVIQMHSGIFQELAAGEQMSDLERLRLIRSLLHALPVDSVLGRVTPGQDRSSDILSRISQLRKENVSPEQVRMAADAWEEEVQTTPTGKERDPESKAYKDDVRRCVQTREFADIYEQYVAGLRERHAYDYDDMILLTIRALQENDWLLAQLQERYQYFLVDEFQDLNGSQHALIELLITYPNTDNAPNVFVVGDDDQAIYRFQGASIKNMLSFTRKFPTAKRVTLSKNYRSTQPILDASSAVIERNLERLARIEKLSKELVAASKKGGEKPRFLRYGDTSLERAGIVDMLTKAHAEKTPWKEMAVLCRTNANVAELADILAVAGIPAVVGAKQDLLATSSVQKLVALLRAVRTMDNASLGAALRAMGCHPAELGTVFVGYRDAGGSRIEAGENADSLRLYMHRTADALPSGVREAFLVLEGLYLEQSAMTVTELTETLIRRSGLLPPVDARSADPRGLAALQSFYDFVKARTLEHAGSSLEKLLADVDQYLSEKTLKLEYDLPHMTGDGVQLLTAHGAKGLEFDVVILSDVRDKHWGNRRKQVGVALPDHLLFNTDVDDEKIADMEDERRLFFVAMTRARRELILTFPEVTRSGAELKDAVPSAFLADAGATIDEVKNAGDGLSPILTIAGSTIDIDSAFKAYLLKRLETYELSVTALGAFLEDPQDFLWNHLLQMPKAKQAHLAYGSAVHSALEAQNRAWKDREEFGTADMLAAFDTYIKAKEILTDRELEHYRRIGHIVLERHALRHTLPPIVFSAERTMKAILPNPSNPLLPGVPLTGKVDRIDLFEIDGRRCRILDYKTGTPKRTIEAVRSEEPLLHQLVFYKILADRSVGFAHDAVLFTFDFLGSDKDDPSTIDVEVTQDDVRALEDLIRVVWGKILALDFTPLEPL